MLVLGIIIVLGMVLHLYNFWWNMMAQELLDPASAIYGTCAGVPGPADGYAWIEHTFANPVYTVIYLLWFAAIWFHLTHGFWSAMQTLGINGKVWFCRWKVIGTVYTTVLMLGFAVVAIAFTLK